MHSSALCTKCWAVQVEASLHAKCLNPARRNRRCKRLAEDWSQLFSAAHEADLAYQQEGAAKPGDAAAGLQELSLQQHGKPVAPLVLESALA